MWKRLAMLGIVLLLALWWGVDFRADDEEAVPQGVIPAPPESEISIKIWTTYQTYSPQEAVQIHLRLSRDAYVYVYDIDPEGTVTLLFPNGFSRDNLLKAGEYVLPDKSSYSFVVEETYGTETLQAIALLRPIPLLELSAQSIEEVPFPKLKGDPETLKPQVEKLIEITVEPGEWAADWTRFVVVPAVAHLLIDTEPPGAEVYIDGELRGQSPLLLDLEPGRVTITIAKEGYRRWTRTVTLEKRVLREIDVQLASTTEVVPAGPGPSPSPPPSGERGSIPLSTLIFGVNAGLNREGIFSVGADLGLARGLRMGGSVTFTEDEEIPDYFDIGAPTQFEREKVYNLGPETEAYLKLSWPLMERVHLQVGVGIAVQERVHIAVPPGVIIVSGSGPLVEILPNGYRETVGYPTFFGGLAFEAGSSLLSVGYHSRRGWLLGFDFRF
jgi:hypothetical protein